MWHKGESKHFIATEDNTFQRYLAQLPSKFYIKIIILPSNKKINVKIMNTNVKECNHIEPGYFKTSYTVKKIYS
jgi:hypothetical protein